MKVIRLFVILTILMMGKAVAVDYSEAMSEATRNTQTLLAENMTKSLAQASATDTAK